jgi:hypothetical protein
MWRGLGYFVLDVSTIPVLKKNEDEREFRDMDGYSPFVLLLWL